MGRRPDAPEDQKAKGYPGKRRTKIDRLIADAEARAQLLAESPGETADVLSPPALIEDPMLKDALWIWRRMAPQLRQQNLFTDRDRLTFAMYCVYQAEFFRANADVLSKGYVMMGRATAGGQRPWTNPAVDIRDTAAKMVLELSKRFALTPLDRVTMEKLHSTARDPGPLFGDEGDESGKEPAEAPVVSAEPDAIGILERLDSPPPGSRPN